MKTARLLIGVIAGLLSTQMVAAQTRDDPRMPPGPNRELVIKACIGCHPLDFLYSTVGRTRDGWNRTLDDMTNYGMNVTPQERAQLLEYLVTSLARSAEEMHHGTNQGNQAVVVGSSGSCMAHERRSGSRPDRHIRERDARAAAQGLRVGPRW